VKDKWENEVAKTVRGLDEIRHKEELVYTHI